MSWLSWLGRPATAWALAGLTVLLAVPLVPLSLAARQNPVAAGGVYLVLGLALRRGSDWRSPGTGRGTRSGG